MKLSVSIIVFPLKVGIKQLDKEYDIQTFIQDIIEAFGEKTGEKISKMLVTTKSDLDKMLGDNYLKEIGIKSDQIEATRENTKALLKYVRIDSQMLINNDCNIGAIVDYLVSENIHKTGLAGDVTAIDNVRLALRGVVERAIDLATENNEFLSGILIDIKKRVEHGERELEKISIISSDTRDNTEELLRRQAIQEQKMDAVLKMFTEMQETNGKAYIPHVACPEHSEKSDVSIDTFLPMVLRR